MSFFLFLSNSPTLSLLFSALIFVAAGTVVGWLASRIRKGPVLGLLADILVGIIGAVLIGGGLLSITNSGGYVMGELLRDTPLSTDASYVVTLIVLGVVGAVVLLLLVSLFKKKPAAAQH